MSATDQNISFSNPGLFTQWQQTKDLLHNTWNAPTSSTSVENFLSGSLVRQGFVTPGYHNAVQTGGLRENTFTFTRDTHTNLFGVNGGENSTRRFKNSGAFKASYGLPPTPLVPSSIRIANLKNRVNLEVLQKIKDQNVDLSVVWGERHETLATIATAAKRFKNAWTAAKSGNWPAAAAALGVRFKLGGQTRTFAQGWLELQYGWLPMLDDIYGACKELQKSRDKNEYVTVKASRRLEETIVYAEKPYDNLSNSYSVDYKVTCKMRRSSSTLQTFAATGITNPLSVVWELTKYSFVVDWFLKIGSFISQFDASLGWEFSSASCTTFIKSRSDRHRLSTKASDYWDALAYWEKINCTRVALSSFTCLWSLPAFKDPLSVKHTLSALALLTHKR